MLITAIALGFFGFHYFRRERKDVIFTVTALDPAMALNWQTLSYSGSIPAGPSLSATTITEHDPEISAIFEAWILLSPGNGQHSQIARNDCILKVIMYLAGLRDTNFMRNLHVESTAETTCPEFAALYRNIPLFIAEEKGGDDINGAIDACINKFRWMPCLQNLPFYTCFAFSFTQAALVVMRRGQNAEIFSLSVCTCGQKIELLRRAITYARILKHFVKNDLVPATGLSFGMWHERPDGKMIRLNFDGFEVKCETKQKFSNLKLFYTACRHNLVVPHIEFSTGNNPTTRHFYLQPVGIAVHPRHFHQLCDALRCVVAAVWGIHGIGWLH
jgi:hypothetical protein